MKSINEELKTQQMTIKYEETSLVIIRKQNKLSQKNNNNNNIFPQPRLPHLPPYTLKSGGLAE